MLVGGRGDGVNENESVGVAHCCEFSWQPGERAPLCSSLQDCFKWDKAVESCQWLAAPCTMLSPLWLDSTNLVYPPVHNSLSCRDLVSGAGGAAGGLVSSDPFPQRVG